MAVSLNFSKEDKPGIKSALGEFRAIATKTDFEEERWLVNGCTVTLYSTGKLVIQGKGEESIKHFIMDRLGLKEELLLGIDEAGRGESTGSMTVSLVLGDKNRLRELRDSKKVSDLDKKESIVTKNALATATFSFSSRYIDFVRKKGVTLNELQRRVIEHAPRVFLFEGEKLKLKVDGRRLRGAPKEVEFVVKGDDLDPVIGAASVLAKVAREKSGDKGKRETWNSSPKKVK